MELLMDRGSFLPEEPITGRAPGAGTLTVSHLGRILSVSPCAGPFSLDALPEGGYAIAWSGGAGERAHGSFDVLADPWSRLRYGFVADFGSKVDAEAHARWAARLHLTAVQFYDWAWRHEVLVSPEPEYADPMGRVVSNATLRALRDAYRGVGAESCAYAAVYAVDREGWERWSAKGLYRGDGRPHQLGGDFLWILDPSDEQWQAHLAEQLRAAVEHGFTAFHLDQYGWPKRAFRADGSPVDLRSAFPSLLNRLGTEVDARWMFNNVNDFPTEDTARAHQDATYIEVWDPHTTYQDLQDVVAKARAANPTRTVVLAAYLPQLADGSDASTDAALLLTQAAICSAGGQHLIAGGTGQVLVDPYYVNNRKLRVEAQELLVRTQDLVVAIGDLLYDRDRLDVTRRWSFGINEELRLHAEVPVRPDAEPGTLWVRVVESRHGLTLHCINLLDQVDVDWNRAKLPIRSAAQLRISLEPFFDRHSVTWWDDLSGAESHSSEVSIVDGRMETVVEIRHGWTVIHIARAL